jgi:hypothetical protein
VDGQEQQATKALVKVARKIFSDAKHTLWFNTVLSARELDDKGLKMTKKVACQTNLEKDEYLSVVSNNIACFYFESAAACSMHYSMI